MKEVQEARRRQVPPTWEEESGFLRFLANVPAEVERFNESFGFGIRMLASPPADVDGNEGAIRDIAFVVLRENRLIPDRLFCLYAVLRGRSLYGYIGIYRDGHISTYRELDPMNEFAHASAIYDWLKSLVRVSCEK